MLVINTITFWIRILIFLPLIIFTIVDYPADAWSAFSQPQVAQTRHPPLQWRRVLTRTSQAKSCLEDRCSVSWCFMSVIRHVDLGKLREDKDLSLYLRYSMILPFSNSMNPSMLRLYIYINNYIYTYIYICWGSINRYPYMEHVLLPGAAPVLWSSSCFFSNTCLKSRNCICSLSFPNNCVIYIYMFLYWGFPRLLNHQQIMHPDILR